ncbi:MAG TPA: HD domain-containing protein [Bryobacteraceae bacterium]|nr:HD domain-containing protein [Bryobacteraceae bacterium]
MKSPFVSDLQPDQIVNATFLVQHKDVRQKKSGDLYLSLTLADRTGELDAKMWDNAAEAVNAFAQDDFIRVKGLMQVFQNRPQLTLHKIQAVPESEIDVADYFPASKRDRDEMFRELQGWIASIGNPHLKALLDAVFADEAIALAYRTAPAAKAIHHAWIGGLIEHVLSMCALAKFTAAHYANIDLDLLLAGVILHDVGKIRELNYARSFSYSTQGQLLGHIVIGVQMVEDKLRLVPDFPPALRDLLLHLILSHHGELEFGSPKVPLFPEALLLHHLDNLDSKMECMRGLIERDRQIEGVWTGYSSALDRTALKKNKYLQGPEETTAPEPPAQPPRTTSKPPKPEPSASPFASKLKDALKSDS